MLLDTLETRRGVATYSLEQWLCPAEAGEAAAAARRITAARRGM